MITITKREERISMWIVLVGVLNQGVSGIGFAINADRSWDLFSFISVDLFKTHILADFFYILVLISAFYLTFAYISSLKKNKNRKS